MLQGDAFKNRPGADAFGMIDDEICFETTSLYWWLCVKEETEHMRDVQQRFKDQVHRGARLPPRYDRALACLELVLVNQMNVRGLKLFPMIIQRPGFTRHFKIEALPNAQISLKKNHSASIATMLWDDPLYWCCANLCAKPDTTGGFDHGSLFTFLDSHLAQSPAKERARLDSSLLDQLSDHAANHQLLRAVRLHRPQNKAGDLYEMHETENRKAWKDKMTTNVIGGSHVTRGVLLKRFYQSELPGGRRDMTWIAHDEKVHGSLGAYWSAIRQAAGSQPYLSDQEVENYLCADLEPSHLVAVKAARDSVRQDVESRKVVPQPSREIQIASEQGGSVGSAEPLSIKVKTKTRGQPPDNGASKGTCDLIEDGVTATDPTTRTEESPNFIPTTKRALDVFSKMFPHSEMENSAKGLEWDQFVHAMKDVGFSARTATGSAVIFEATDTGSGRIIFHNPHPTPKIDPIMLRAMGKRMTKWFGWQRERFVPEL